MKTKRFYNFKINQIESTIWEVERQIYVSLTINNKIIRQMHD